MYLYTFSTQPNSILDLKIKCWFVFLFWWLLLIECRLTYIFINNLVGFIKFICLSNYTFHFDASAKNDYFDANIEFRMCVRQKPQSWNFVLVFKCVILMTKICHLSLSLSLYVCVHVVHAMYILGCVQRLCFNLNASF